MNFPSLGISEEDLPDRWVENKHAIYSFLWMTWATLMFVAGMNVTPVFHVFTALGLIASFYHSRKYDATPVIEEDSENEIAEYCRKNGLDHLADKIEETDPEDLGVEKEEGGSESE